jgi:hypothetical protein
MSVHRDYQHSRVGQQMADELDRILLAEGKTQAAVAELSAFGTQKVTNHFFVISRNFYLDFYTNISLIFYSNFF